MRAVRAARAVDGSPHSVYSVIGAEISNQRHQSGHSGEGCQNSRERSSVVNTMEKEVISDQWLILH